jgi:hypothetical protein
MDDETSGFTRRHLAMLDGTWCGEKYDDGCVLSPSRCTCMLCLSRAEDYGELCKRAFKKLAFKKNKHKVKQ